MANDASIPAAIIFIDSLGTTLPFRNRFTYKELDDFCKKEGIAGIADGVSEPDLIKIAYFVEGITNGHVKIVAGPTESKVRSPLSKLDMNIAHRKAENECKRCGDPSGEKMLCEGCTQTIEFNRHAAETVRPSVEPIRLFAHAQLQDGTAVHVVEIRGERFIGVDDDFIAHEFGTTEVRQYTNMEEPLTRYGSCGLCGTDLFDPVCANCGTGSA